MTAREIDCRVDNATGWVTINRPAQRNAISKVMWEHIPTMLSDMVNQGARTIVFRGDGGNFASGADLSELADLNTEEEASKHWHAIRHALNAVASCEVPTMAMIQGHCLGGGCLLSMACDMRFCDPSARFAVPTAQLGIFLDQHNIARLQSLVGRANASELLFTGCVISAARAEQIGLVNAMVPAIDLYRLVTGIAENIKANAPAAIKHSKRSMVDLMQRMVDEPDQSEIVESYLSDEFRQRASKALAKAKPSSPKPEPHA